jgi:hypothetical protein
MGKGQNAPYACDFNCAVSIASQHQSKLYLSLLTSADLVYIESLIKYPTIRDDKMLQQILESVLRIETKIKNVSSSSPVAAVGDYTGSREPLSSSP